MWSERIYWVALSVGKVNRAPKEGQRVFFPHCDAYQTRRDLTMRHENVNHVIKQSLSIKLFSIADWNRLRKLIDYHARHFHRRHCVRAMSLLSNNFSPLNAIPIGKRNALDKKVSTERKNHFNWSFFLCFERSRYKISEFEGRSETKERNEKRSLYLSIMRLNTSSRISVMS